MVMALKVYRQECLHNLEINNESRRDRELETVKEEVLNLSDKFDYFIASLLRSGLIKPDHSNEDALLNFTNSLGNARDAGIQNPEVLRQAVKTYQENATECDLGDRQKIRMQAASRFNDSHAKRWVDLKTKLKQLRKEKTLQRSRSNSIISEHDF